MELAADRRADAALRQLAGVTQSATAVLRSVAVAASDATVGREGGPLDEGTQRRIQDSRASGRPLATPVRQRMESAFGAGFGGVRVHDDDDAAHLTARLAASAFTSGRDIYFGRGQFAPDTADGARVLAHELAHTLQPDGAAPIRRDIKIAEPERIYKSSVPEDKVAFANIAAGTSANKELATQIATWMLGSHPQDFPTDAKLQRYVGDIVSALDNTKPTYQIASNPLVKSKPEWPTEEQRKAQQLSLFKQNPQERGDMHDLRAIMTLRPKVHVAVEVKDPRRLDDAATIIDYYRGFGHRVRLYTDEKAPNGKGPSEATEMLLTEAKKKPIGAELKKATTGNADVTYADAYDEVLAALHFPSEAEGTAYGLVNFRVSGHGVTGPRSPSHPELDTGTTGFQQLWQAVLDKGYQPVPVGTVPAEALAGCLLGDGAKFDTSKHPHLINYFMHVGPVVTAAAEAAKREAATKSVGDGSGGPDAKVAEADKPAPVSTLSKRQIEYGIFARLASKFPKTRAVGMRSGGLDAIAFAGIPVLSVDIAIGPDDPLRKTLKPAHGSPQSWKRAAKRELILPGAFHQVFMDALRPLGDLKEAGWQGELSDTSVKRITAALTTFFGEKESAGTRKSMLKSQPRPVNEPDKGDVVNLMANLQKIRAGKGGTVVITEDLGNALGIADSTMLASVVADATSGGATGTADEKAIEEAEETDELEAETLAEKKSTVGSTARTPEAKPYSAPLSHFPALTAPVETKSRRSEKEPVTPDVPISLEKKVSTTGYRGGPPRGVEPEKKSGTAYPRHSGSSTGARSERRETPRSSYRGPAEATPYSAPLSEFPALTAPVETKSPRSAKEPVTRDVPIPDEKVSTTGYRGGPPRGVEHEKKVGTGYPLYTGSSTGPRSERRETPRGSYGGPRYSEAKSGPPSGTGKPASPGRGPGSGSGTTTIEKKKKKKEDKHFG
jgi:hypothetical protein